MSGGSGHDRVTWGRCGQLFTVAVGRGGGCRMTSVCCVPTWISGDVKVVAPRLTPEELTVRRERIDYTAFS